MHTCVTDLCPLRAWAGPWGGSGLSRVVGRIRQDPQALNTPVCLGHKVPQNYCALSQRQLVQGYAFRDREYQRVYSFQIN